MKKLKFLSLVGDTGYFDKEVNYAGSEALVGVKVVNIKPHVDPFVFPVVLSFSTSCNRCGHHRLCPRTTDSSLPLVTMSLRDLVFITEQVLTQLDLLCYQVQ